MIVTKRLVLTKITAEDIDLIFDINNDPKCIQFNNWNSMSMEQCKAVIDNWISKYKDSDQTGVFCVKCIERDVKIGMAYIISYREVGQYEIGFRLRSSYWNRGYAKEITLGFIQHAEHNLNANEIVAEVHKLNTRSRNIFEKLGFDMSIHPDGDDGLLYKYVISKKS